MKNTCYRILLAFTLFSCQSSTSPETSETDNTNELEETISKFQGTWVNRKYVQTLLKSKSPFEAQEKDPYYILYIKPDMIKNNTIGIFDYKYRQSEASVLKYYYAQNNSLIYSYSTFDDNVIDEPCKKNCAEIKIKVYKTDTILLVERENHLIEELIRIDSKCIDEHHTNEITKLITSNILAGDYELLDSSKTSICPNLIIDNNGLISNFPGYQRAVLWDFFYESNWIYSFDVLEFIPTGNEIDDYGYYNHNDNFLYQFKIINDTIQLLSTKRLNDDDKVKAGNIKYYLAKNKN